MQPARRNTGTLDDTSRAIIAQLQQDGRRTYSAIAAEVGLSEAAVRQRVQRLLESGVIQVVAITDPRRVGFTRSAMIGIRVTGDLDAVADAMAGIDEITYLLITAGNFDILAEAVCVDDAHLLEVVNNRIRRLDGVEHVEIFVYLNLRKETYVWSAR